MATPTRFQAPLIATLTLCLVAPLALAHFDDKEVNQSYRQSYFALLAMNFGPLAAMVKGEMAWSDESFAHYANDLAVISSLDLMRGFEAGSEKGTTRAKPEIWSNQEDFEKKLEDLRAASAELKKVAQTGDRKAMTAQFAATGKTCKACHDDYKSKNYLY